MTRQQTFLPTLLVTAAILTLLCYVAFPVPKLEEGEKNFYLESWPQIALLSCALMFPVAFLSGVLFPAIAARVQESVPSRMNSLGITTLFNTAGAAIGPLLAGFVLQPKLGFQSSLIICAVGYGVLCLTISQKVNWSPKRSTGLVLLGLSILFIASVALFPFHRDEMHFANARKLFESEEQHLVKKIEGTTGTWQLLRRDLFGQPYYYRLMTDGFSMSATNPRNQRYMRLFAYLPSALHPQPQDALLIAFGCGVTADALTHDVDLKHIDIVDISKEAFALADDYRGRRLLELTARSSRHCDCSGWPVLFASQSATLRHHHGRTAPAKSSRVGESLHRAIFLADERSIERWRHRDFLAAGLPAQWQRSESNPARIPRRVSEHVRLVEL
jgi:hypothetical protein